MIWITLALASACAGAQNTPVSAITDGAGNVHRADVAAGPIGIRPGLEAVPPSRVSSHGAGASLIGVTPIYLGEERESVFHYSLAISSGYLKTTGSSLDESGTLTLGEGYVSGLLRRRRFTMLVQHDAQFTNSPDIGKGVGQYQRTSVSFTGVKSRLTEWSFLLENGYGMDAARAVGNLGTAVINGEAVPDQNTVAFGLTSGNVLTDHMIFRLDHKLSLSRTMNVSIGSYFHHFFNTASSNQQYSVDAGLQQRWTTRQTVGFVLEAVQENYTTLHCTTGSVGLYSLTQLSHRVRFEGTAGPVWGSAYCAGNYQYNVSLAMDTTRGGLLYVGSTRQRNDGLVLASTWETSTFGGLVFGESRRIQIRASGGYASYTVTGSTPSNSNLHGYFVAGEVHHRIAQASEVSLTARHFSHSESQSLSNSNMFLITSTFTWSPETRSTRRWNQRRADGNR